MSFAEVLAAAVVLACASSGSLQIWAASAAASRTAEQRQALLVELDGALLAAEALLRAPLGAVASADCQQAVAWMRGELEQAPLPSGLQRQVEPLAAGVWLKLQAEPLPPRQRWLDAAALGLCAPPPAPVAPPEPVSQTDPLHQTDPLQEAAGDGPTV